MEPVNVDQVLTWALDELLPGTVYNSLTVGSEVGDDYMDFEEVTDLKNFRDKPANLCICFVPDEASVVSDPDKWDEGREDRDGWYYSFVADTIEPVPFIYIDMYFVPCPDGGPQVLDLAHVHTEILRKNITYTTIYPCRLDGQMILKGKTLSVIENEVKIIELNGKTGMTKHTPQAPALDQFPVEESIYN